MTGSRPSRGSVLGIRSGAVHRTTGYLATPPVTVTHTTVPTEPTTVSSLSLFLQQPPHSARINNTPRFDSQDLTRGRGYGRLDSRNGTGGTNAEGHRIVKPPGLRAHLRASTVLHAFARSTWSWNGPYPGLEPYTRERVGRLCMTGEPPSAQRTLPAIYGPYQMRPSIRAPFTLHVFDVSPLLCSGGGTLSFHAPL